MRKEKKGSRKITPQLIELISFTPEGVNLKAISKINYPPRDFPKKDYGEICTDEDCKCPFFSEAYLYNLVGKEDARTLLALFKQAMVSLGINKDEIEKVM